MNLHIKNRLGINEKINKPGLFNLSFKKEFSFPINFDKIDIDYSGNIKLYKKNRLGLLELNGKLEKDNDNFIIYLKNTKGVRNKIGTLKSAAYGFDIFLKGKYSFEEKAGKLKLNSDGSYDFYELNRIGLLEKIGTVQI